MEQHIALSLSRVRPSARDRIDALGMLEGEPVFAANRAAIGALTPPVGWVERLRDRLSPPSGPPTEPIHITPDTS